MAPFGTHTLATDTNAHSTDTSGSFIIAQNLDDFTSISSNLIAGMNAVATDTYFNATFSPSTAYAMLLDLVVDYNVLLACENGIALSFFLGVY